MHAFVRQIDPGLPLVFSAFDLFGRYHSQTKKVTSELFLAVL